MKNRITGYCRQAQPPVRLFSADLNGQRAVRRKLRLRQYGRYAKRKEIVRRRIDADRTDNADKTDFLGSKYGVFLNLK